MSERTTETQLTHDLKSRLKDGYIAMRLTGQTGLSGYFMIYKPLDRSLGGEIGSMTSVGNKFLLYPDGSFDPEDLPNSALANPERRSAS